MPESLRARAERCYVLASEAGAAADATALVQRARAAGDPAAEATAGRARAIALGPADIDGALDAAREAIEAARRSGEPGLADRIAVTQAGLLVGAGRLAEAEAVLDRAAAGGHPRAVPESLVTRGGLAVVRADPRAARQMLDEAIGTLDPADIWWAHARANRGLLAAMSGEFEAAVADLTAAAAGYRRLSCAVAAAQMSLNLAWVADLRGDYVGGLRLLEGIEGVLAASRQGAAPALLARATLLLAAGLAGLAAEDAAAAADAGDEADRAEALLLLAEAHTMSAEPGSIEAAAAAAAAAEKALVAQDRPRLADRARLLALRSRTDRATVGPDDVRAARELADRMAVGGQMDVALQARLAAAGLAVRSGDLDGAARDLALAAPARAWPSADVQIGFWTAHASLRAGRGDTRGTLAAARAGLAVLAEFQATLGATEARVNSAAAAERLGALALPAVTGAAALLEWSERVRAGTARFRPVRPPSAADLARETTELRMVTSQVRDAASPEEAAVARRRQAELERAVRTRLLTAAGTDAATHRVTAGEIRAALGEAVLVSFVDIGSRLVAVRVDARRARIVDLGPSAAVHSLLGQLRFALVGLGRGLRAPSLVASLADTAAQLDARLLRAVDPEGRPLVVVPTRRLFTLPWAALPGGRERAVTVAPSAAVWIAAGGRAVGPGRVVVAAGPDVPHAPAEVARVAAVWPGAVTLSGDAAAAGAVLAAIDGAALFHLAGHGVLRADNPLFSHLRMADGPLAVHDIEGLRRAPSTVVLSACDSALALPRPGGEWLGMASALLGLGSRSLVASVLPVPDSPVTVELMARLHATLAHGVPASQALRAAASDVDRDDPVAVATVAAFVCFGR